MKKHIPILLILWGLLSFVGAIYFWSNSQRLHEANKRLLESNALHKQAIGKEVESYKVIHDCFVVNRGMCNSEEFEIKLQTLGDEADSLYDQISNLENEKH